MSDFSFLCTGHCKRYRATGPESTWTWLHPQASLWNIPPIRRPCVTAVRREVNRKTQGHLQNTHDTGLVTISFPRAVCRTGPSDYQLWFMTCIREEDDQITYRHICPTGPPVDGVKSALTPALWPCTFCSDPSSRVYQDCTNQWRCQKLKLGGL